MIFKELMDHRNYLIHAYFGNFLVFTLVAKPVFCFWEEFQSCGKIPNCHFFAYFAGASKIVPIVSRLFCRADKIATAKVQSLLFCSHNATLSMS
jgi:hypothetical protein